MSTSASFVPYVLELLEPLGDLYVRKMFGEYGLYCDGTFFALICDNTLYFQLDDSIAGEFKELESAYPGGKPIGKITEDILENRDELIRLGKLSYEYKKRKSMKKASKKKSL